MCDCELNPAEFFNSNYVRGRKEHECCECLRLIPVGELQEVASGKWDGRFAMFRTCMMCVDLRGEMQLDCWCFTQLIEEATQNTECDKLSGVIAFIGRRKENYDRIIKLKEQLSDH